MSRRLSNFPWSHPEACLRIRSSLSFRGIVMSGLFLYICFALELHPCVKTKTITCLNSRPHAQTAFTRTNAHQHASGTVKRDMLGWLWAGQGEEGGWGCLPLHHWAWIFKRLQSCRPPPSCCRCDLDKIHLDATLFVVVQVDKWMWTCANMTKRRLTH